ncbi:MAG: neutral/alkaline non-lysosomal ceramidase N-terminal domain-containing protein, partial [Desulfomonilia bacterium]
MVRAFGRFLRAASILMALCAASSCWSEARAASWEAGFPGREPLYAGAGKADITGTPAMVVFMGMADPSQTGQGLLMRTYARAFVLKQGDRKIAYVSADLCMIFQGVKQEVARKLRNEGWSEENIMLQGTHTHGVPGGTSHYLMYNLPGMGFVRENFQVQVSGIVAAIREAESCLAQVEPRISQGLLFQCGWNRSPRAYLNNPQAEIEHYGRVSHLTSIDHEEGFSNIENLDPGDREHTDDGLSTGYAGGVDWNNTNKRMTLLKLGDSAMVNWFALHPTTLGARFRYVSGDSKGYASILWERMFPGAIGAFAQADCGDVSGNIRYGPPSITGDFDWMHAKELGERQLKRALELYNDIESLERPLTPLIDYRHLYVNMSCVASRDPAVPWRTCRASIGGPMSAGSTEDSRSPLPLYREGITVDDLAPGGRATPAERAASFVFPGALGLISPPAIRSLSPEYRRLQHPKTILLPSGCTLFPAQDGDTGRIMMVPLSPEILPVQLFRIGELILCGMPVEVTTMAGRRIENTIKLVFNGDADGDGWADEEGPVRYVVVCQCANAYAGYLTTPEEYLVQHYEGASTHFGPHELDAFLQVIGDLAVSMRDNTPLDRSEEPKPLYLNGSWMAEVFPGRLLWPLFDRQSASRPFGGIAQGPRFEVDNDGTRYLKLTVWGAFPNRNLMTGGTFMTVRTPPNPSYVRAPRDCLY